MANIQGGVSGALADVDNTTKGLKVYPVAPQEIYFDRDSQYVDAFNRLRVAEPRLAFEWTFANGIRGEVWDNAAYTGGSATPAAAAVAAAAVTPNTDFMQYLNTSTASGSGYWIQSLQHVRYAPGISTLVRFTGSINILQPNTVYRMGMYTDQGATSTASSNQGDGMFFECNGTALAFGRRFFTGGGSGSVEQVLQANWNIDKCDGTGPSGFNLNVTTTFHLVIEWQWLGVGTVRMGFETPKGVIWAHDFISVNVLSVPYTRTGSLPIRAEVVNTGVTAQAGVLRLINVTVIQEGDVMERRGWRYRSIDAGTLGLRTIAATAAVNAWYPLVSIRPASTNDVTKRAQIIPLKGSIQVVSVGTGPTGLRWGLYYGGNPSGATFATAGSELVQVDTVGAPATAITGGILVASGLLPFAANQVKDLDFSGMQDNLHKIAVGAAGTAAASGMQVLSLVVGPVGAAATAAPTFFASLDWKELA